MQEEFKIYQTVNDQQFKENVLNSHLPSVVIFSAKWSGSSYMMRTILERIGAGFSHKCKFFEIDIEANLETPEFFGISKVPTVLVLKTGEVIDYWQGTRSQKEVERSLIEITRDR